MSTISQQSFPASLYFDSNEFLALIAALNYDQSKLFDVYETNRVNKLNDLYPVDLLISVIVVSCATLASPSTLFVHVFHQQMAFIYFQMASPCD